MDLQLTGKRALVTGGSRGIGRAIASALAAEGVDVAIVARDVAKLEQAAGELRAASGRTIVPLTVDTRDDDSVATMVAAARDALGGIDILVNNAARIGGYRAPFEELLLSEVYEDINTKVLGYLRCIKGVVPGMLEAGWGRIINISGLGARQTGTIAGSVRNVGVAALSKNLADELGPRGINVVCVHPGQTKTEIWVDHIGRAAEVAGMTFEEMEARYAAGIGIGRVLSADEVATVVAFLASPRSVALNGDPIIASGGAIGPIHY